MSDSLCLGYLLGWSLLRLLDDAVSGYYKRFFLSVPKGEQPILDLAEQGTELPNLGALQLLEQLNILFSLLHSFDVAVNLLGGSMGKSLDEVVRFLRQYQIESAVTHIGSFYRCKDKKKFTDTETFFRYFVFQCLLLTLFLCGVSRFDLYRGYRVLPYSVLIASFCVVFNCFPDFVVFSIQKKF